MNTFEFNQANRAGKDQGGLRSLGFLRLFLLTSSVALAADSPSVHAFYFGNSLTRLSRPPPIKMPATSAWKMAFP